MKVVSPSSCVSSWFVFSSLEAGLASSLCRDLRQGYQSTFVIARYYASISFSNGQILLSLVISSSNLSSSNLSTQKVRPDGCTCTHEILIFLQTLTGLSDSQGLYNCFLTALFLLERFVLIKNHSEWL